MKMKLFAAFASILIVLAACKSKNSNEDENLDPNTHKVVVKEVIQTSPQYTYLRVRENKQDSWIAITKQDVKKGGTYYYTGGLEMQNFESKDLQRVFESIFFVDNFSDKPIKAGETMANAAPHNMVPKPVEKDVKVTPAENGITIAELYANKEKYSGQKVIIRGEVVKVNKEIMGHNWVHIQDGTSDGDNFDLTVTTDETYEVGDQVTFEGTIALNKDFGAGFSYDVIMENGTNVQSSM